MQCVSDSIVTIKNSSAGSLSTYVERDTSSEEGDFGAKRREPSRNLVNGAFRTTYRTNFVVSNVWKYRRKSYDVNEVRKAGDFARDLQAERFRDNCYFSLSPKA